MERKVRNRQIKTTGIASNEAPVSTINEAEFAVWFHKLKTLRGHDDTIEAPKGVVQKLENDYPNCFGPGYFMFHGIRVVPEGKRDKIESELSLTLEEKMHGAK